MSNLLNVLGLHDPLPGPQMPPAIAIDGRTGRHRQ